MRLTVAHLRDAALIGGVGLIAFAAMRAADHLIGPSPFMPGMIAAIVMAAWIFLLRRYGHRWYRPMDRRRKQIWFLSSLAAAIGMGLLAIVWMQGIIPKQLPSCAAQSWTDAVSPDAKAIGCRS
jgi:hypothetical protein